MLKKIKQALFSRDLRIRNNIYIVVDSKVDYLNNYELFEEYHLNVDYVADNLKTLPSLQYYYEFQKDMLIAGVAEATCPFTGASQKTNISRAYGRFYYYKFINSEYPFWIVCALAKQGFAKQALIINLPTVNLVFLRKNCVSLHSRIKEKIELFTKKTNKVRSHNDFKSLTRKKKKILLCESSFFHFFWNELSALKALYDEQLLDRVDQIMVVKGVFDLSKFFPKTGKKFKYLSAKKIDKLASGQNYFLMKAGSTFISQELIDQTYHYCFESISPAFQRQLQLFTKKHKIILVVSIRALMSKVWLNQVNGISKILNELTSKYNSLGVVFDGFSVAGESKATKIIKRQQEIAKKIISKLEKPETIWNTIGCDIKESIVLARNVDVYLTSHGSQQHKWGWFGNIPGVVHGPKVRMEEAEEFNVTDPAYSIPNPIFTFNIPSQKIERNEKQSQLEDPERNDNYKFDSMLAYEKLDFIINQIDLEKNTTVEEWNEKVISYNKRHSIRSV